MELAAQSRDASVDLSATVFDGRGFIAELAASNQVAHWAYAQAEAANAMTWLRGDEMVALDAGWRGLLSR